MTECMAEALIDELIKKDISDESKLRFIDALQAENSITGVITVSPLITMLKMKDESILVNEIHPKDSKKNTLMCIDAEDHLTFMTGYYLGKQYEPS